MSRWEDSDLTGLQTGDPTDPDYRHAIRGTWDEPPEELPRPRGYVAVDHRTGAVYASWAPADVVLEEIARWRARTVQGEATGPSEGSTSPGRMS